VDEITQLGSRVQYLEVGDVPRVLPGIVTHFSPVIERFAGPGELARASFREEAKEVLRRALELYFQKEERSGPDGLQKYLYAALRSLRRAHRDRDTNRRRLFAPVCPYCRSRGGQREVLAKDGDGLRCARCTALARSSRGRAIFAWHSRLGWKCPMCRGFIPRSVSSGESVTCPHYGCVFHGLTISLTDKRHPVTSVTAPAPASLEVVAPVASPADAHARLEVRETYESELRAVKGVVEGQLRLAQRAGGQRGLIRRLAHWTFFSLVESDPILMVSYLAHRRLPSGVSIQARVFQRFVDIVSSSLPIPLWGDGERTTLEDSGIFAGRSEFVARAHDGFIPNLTQERYTTGTGNDLGRCFIGHLLGVENQETGENMMPRVKEYTFARVWGDFPDGPMRVSHLRLFPHYELGPLVALQRARRRIVDRVYFRLNGRPRVPT